MRGNSQKAGKNRRFQQKPDRILEYTVREDSTLLNYVITLYPDKSRTTIKSLLAHDQIAINNIPVRQFDAAIVAGDKLSVNFDRPFKVFSHPRIRMVYEDDDVIVIHKGYGVLSMGTDDVKEGTAYRIVSDYMKYKDVKSHLFIVHRLDRDTSGLMMFAKNIEAKEAMQHNWNNMVIERKYVALVEGTIEEPEGVVRSYLAETSQFEVYSTEDKNKGQLAVTRYKTLKAAKGYTLLELSLDTGRKNQIRVHMHDIGHPIVGDRKYGAKSSPIGRLALHAAVLRFAHPITRKDMRFESPIPSKFFYLLSDNK